MASSGAVFAAGPVGVLVAVVLRQQERTPKVMALVLPS
jgi:hypothetical protein